MRYLIDIPGSGYFSSGSSCRDLMPANRTLSMEEVQDMRKKSRYRLLLFLTTPALALSVLFAAGSGPGNTGHLYAQDKKVTVDINKEDRDVGLKRMEILDKSLTPELIQENAALVRAKEQDYNKKIGDLLRRITTPIGINTVITHIDTNPSDPNFAQQLHTSENIRVTILMDKDGFAKWASGKSSDEAARKEIATLIHRTFNIPEPQISIVITPS